MRNQSEQLIREGRAVRRGPLQDAALILLSPIWLFGIPCGDPPLDDHRLGGRRDHVVAFANVEDGREAHRDLAFWRISYLRRARRRLREDG